MFPWTIKACLIFAVAVLSLLVSAGRAAAAMGVSGYICGVGHSASNSLPYIGSVGNSGYVRIDLTSQPNCQGAYYLVVACSSGATSGFCTARFSETVLMRHIDLLRVSQEKQALVYMYLTEAIQGGYPIYNPLNFFYYK